MRKRATTTAESSFRSVDSRPSRSTNWSTQLEGEVDEHLAQEHLADDDGGQTDDDGAAAHVHGGAALVLGQQAAGEGHQAVGHHQAQHLGGVGVDALGTGHVGVGAGGTEGAAQLGAEEPVEDGDDHHGEDGQQKKGIAEAHLTDVAGGDQQGLLVHTEGQGGLGAGAAADGHDTQVDGVEGQLGQDAGEDSGDTAGGVEQTGDQTGQHAGDNGHQEGHPGVEAHGDAQGGHGAAGGQGAIHG